MTAAALRVDRPQRTHTHSRRKASGGKESGQTGSHLVPCAIVINQGARKTQARVVTVPSAPVTARRRTAPSRSMAISPTAPWRAHRTVSADTIIATADAVHSSAGRRGSPVIDAQSNRPVTARVVTRAHPRQRRSSADGCNVVQVRITQRRLKTRVPFVPPKPNEFFIATSILISRAVLAQ